MVLEDWMKKNGIKSIESLLEDFSSQKQGTHNLKSRVKGKENQREPLYEESKYHRQNKSQLYKNGLFDTTEESQFGNNSTPKVMD